MRKGIKKKRREKKGIVTEIKRGIEEIAITDDNVNGVQKKR